MSSQERKLSAFPYIEICGSDVINYMVPLSRQTDFFVPEMKEEAKTEVKEEDSDEDRGTDITGNTVTGIIDENLCLALLLLVCYGTFSRLNTHTSLVLKSVLNHQYLKG